MQKIKMKTSKQKKTQRTMMKEGTMLRHRLKMLTMEMLTMRMKTTTTKRMRWRICQLVVAFGPTLGESYKSWKQSNGC